MPIRVFGGILYGMANLVKYVAACGAASRRGAETLIRSGAVTVNGAAEVNPARQVAETDAVALNGRPLVPAAEKRYILLHKPRGYVCSSADAHAAHLALELIDLPGTRLVSAGRLDKESEGAIIFSNDGAFVHVLTHPRHGVLKRYRVSVRPALSPAALARIRAGIADDGEVLRAREVNDLGGGEYEFVLNEGRKREIRRLVKACGSVVTKLVRRQIGAVELGDLPSGAWRDLTAAEVSGLLRGGGAA